MKDAEFEPGPTKETRPFVNFLNNFNIHFISKKGALLQKIIKVRYNQQATLKQIYLTNW